MAGDYPTNVFNHGTYPYWQQIYQQPAHCAGCRCFENTWITTNFPLPLNNTQPISQDLIDELIRRIKESEVVNTCPNDGIECEHD